MREFYCNDGSVAFVIPFLFTSDDNKEWNKCVEILSKIKPNDDKEQYDIYKEELVETLAEFFPNAQNVFCGTTIRYGIDQEPQRRCRYCDNKNNVVYKGRNLCPCFSISRKFHDDKSKNVTRIEIFLDTCNVHYELTGKKVYFDFCIDQLLLLTNEEGVECGYLVFNISLQSIKENGFSSRTGNSLDNIIFLKHLFYKGSLKCSCIGDVIDISIQDWAEKIICNLLSALEIRQYDRSISNEIMKDEKKNVAGAAFRYSIVELNNVVDNWDNLVQLSDNVKLLEKYQKQIYGLLVSDEGWRYISSNSLSKKFTNNHWTSRGFMSTIFLGHNALFINQYDEAERLSYNDTFEKWYANYKQSNDTAYYEQYVRLRPCVPGVASLTFFSYLNAIAKELKLEKVKSVSSSNALSDEEKYKKISSALQKHSMSLDEIKNIDDCIYTQFGIPAELNELHERYKREADKVQNRKVVNLTHVTALISIAAYFIATLAISRNKDSFYTYYRDWTIGILFASLFIPIVIYIIIVNDLWNKLKRFFRNKCNL